MQRLASTLRISHLSATLLENNRKEKTMQYTAMLLSLCLLVSTGAFVSRALAAEADKTSQTIFRAGSQGSSNGPAEFFTGNVRVDRLFPVNDTAHLSGAYVTFEPGARSAWHTAPDRAVPDRYRWRWPDTGMGRPDRGNQSRRRDLVPATGKTLARCFTHHRNDAYRPHGNNQRQKC